MATRTKNEEQELEFKLLQDSRVKSTQQRWAGKKKIKVTWALGEQVPPLSAIREEQLKFTPLCSFPTVITATLEGTLIDNLTAIPISSSTNLACVDTVHRTVYTVRTSWGPGHHTDPGRRNWFRSSVLVLQRTSAVL